MTLIDLLLLLLIAGVCGAVAQALTGYTRGGCIVSIIVGFVGAFLGLWLANRFDLPTFFVITVGGRAFPIVWSVIGGVVCSVLLGMLTRRR